MKPISPLAALLLATIVTAPAQRAPLPLPATDKHKASDPQATAPQPVPASAAAH